MQTSLPGNNPFEEVKAQGEEEEEEEGFVDPELTYQVADDGKGGDLFNTFPSRAEDALKTCMYRKETNHNASSAVYESPVHKQIVKPLLSVSGSIKAGAGDSADVPGSC